MGRSVIRRLASILTCLLFATFAAQAFAVAAAKSTIVVGGWTVPQLDQPIPPIELGDDPIIGRQACPPLVRLDLTAVSSKPLLVKKVTQNAERTEWRFEARGDVFWWNGKAVQAQDIATFVKDALPRVVRARGLALWPLPEFSTAVDGNTAVVRWREAPKFGPYVFDGVPLTRPATGGKDVPSYECTGLYRMALTPQGVMMTPNPAYGMKLAPIRVDRHTAKLPTQGRWIAIRNANTFGGTPWTRLSDDRPKCSTTLDLPSATVIAWNPARGATSDHALRVLLTELTPRGELIRSGAAALGELISAPIPKQHPGYDARISVRPFNIRSVSERLSKLGYQRQDAYAPRLDKQGKPLRLTLVTAGAPGLAEKVVSDTFSSLGISTVYKPVSDMAPGAADGVFAAVQFDWPRADLIGTLHSRAENPAPFYKLNDDQLDALLERYALSTTEEKPDMNALGAVHRRLFELEPMSVLLQHRACVESGGGLKLPSKGINVRDPDWFRKIVL